MSIPLDALVLPAFDELSGLPSERAAWLETDSFDSTVDIAGVPTPLAYTEDGLGLVPTGVGKSAAAATTTALLASDRLDLSEAPVLSVGVAGGPPTEVPIGSVVITDTIVDWDSKVRFDSGPTETRPLACNPYTETAPVFELDDGVVERTLQVASDVDLETDEAIARRCRQFDEPAAIEEPTVRVGTNCCADELWHGAGLAQQVQWLVDQYDAGTYCVTEMEDFGTALALDRFDRLDQYVSVRGIANFDRPAPGDTPSESLFGDTFDAGFPLGLENAVRVARAIVEEHR